MDRICKAPGCNAVVGYRNRTGYCRAHYHMYRAKWAQKKPKLEASTTDTKKMASHWFGRLEGGLSSYARQGLAKAGVRI